MISSKRTPGRAAPAPALTSVDGPRSSGARWIGRPPGVVLRDGGEVEGGEDLFSRGVVLLRGEHGPKLTPTGRAQHVARDGVGVGERHAAPRAPSGDGQGI